MSTPPGVGRPSSGSRSRASVAASARSRSGAATTALVTGAAGFIGSHLCARLLERGWKVVGLDNFCDFYDPAVKRRHAEALCRERRFTLVECDLRDREAIQEVFRQHLGSRCDKQPEAIKGDPHKAAIARATELPGVVVHLAAMAGVRPSIQNPLLYTTVNIDGTVNLLDASVAPGSKVGRFLFASSSSVYGNNPKVPFAESDNVDRPISPYAATKKAGELICHSYHHLYGLPVFCLRFFTVFGPRQRPDLAIAKFLRLVRDGKPIPMFGDGSMSRDYTYIDDILSGVLAAIDRCGSPRLEPYGIYNLGGNHPTSLSDLLDTIARVTGQRLQIDRLPLQPGDVERTWADLSHSKADLGYSPRTSIEEGIQRQWRSIQNEG